MSKVDEGTIQSFDQGARTIDLDGGRHYDMAPQVDATAWRAGDFVRITYTLDSKTGGRIADAVSKASPVQPEHHVKQSVPDHRGLYPDQATPQGAAPGSKPGDKPQPPPSKPPEKPAPAHGRVNTTASMRTSEASAKRPPNV